jgi:PP-loop superfamily ATP-utilizing enzyme
MALEAFFKENGSVALGFSGGVDLAYRPGRALGQP